MAYSRGVADLSELGKSRPIASINSRIFFAIFTVAVCTGVVKLAGLAKVVAVAGRFGTGDDLDAWLIAFLVPAFLADAVAGSVSASLVPAFVEVREHQGSASAQRLFSSVTTVLLASLVLVSLAASWLAPAIMPPLAPGFGEKKLELTVSLMRTMLPIAVFGGIASVWRGILNAEESFAVAALTPILTPLAVICFLFFGGRTMGVSALAFGTVSGCVCEWCVVAFALRQKGFPLRLRWYGADPVLKRVFSQYAPMIGATIVIGASALVDQSMAARLGPGSVSVFTYGLRLVALVTAMGPTVVSTAVFPQFSRLVALGEYGELRHSLKTVLLTVLLCTIPLVAGLLIFSEPAVRIVFKHGAFAESDATMVAGVQRLALFQIPFYILAAPMVRLLSALKANHYLLRAAVLHLGLTTGLDYACMRLWGVAGIGLATAIVAAVYFCYLSSVVSMKLDTGGNGALREWTGQNVSPR
jgi:putative peptidoglycan lipid II flippase